MKSRASRRLNCGQQGRRPRRASCIQHLSRPPPPSGPGTSTHRRPRAGAPRPPGARVTGARLTGARLTGARLTAARLTGARLTGARLTGARLTGARLTGSGACGRIGAMTRSAPRHDRDAGGPADLLAAKAALRQEVWTAMRAAKVARFPGAAGRIPNCTGAEAAAEHLRALPAWQAAATVKSNPDSAQW